MATPDLIPAASYARISETDKKRDKVADQHAQNAAHAAARGYRIVAKYEDDGISALGGKTRPDFERMLADAGNGEWSVIVATEEERLARNVEEKLLLHAACEDAAIVWDTARDGYVDPATDSGEFMSTVRAAMGRIESKRKARRQRSANLDRAARGEPNPGKRRYGYEVDGRTPRPDEAAVVRRIFKHLAADGSVRSISLALAAEGVDPGTAKEWRTGRIRDIAMNPHYAGGMRHRGIVTASAVIEPIVDAQVAEDVRAILSAPDRRTSPGAEPRYLASGFATCGAEGCGLKLKHMRGYVCAEGATKGHAHITVAELDARIRAEVALAIVTTGDELTPPEERATMARLVGELQRIEAAQVATAADRDEGLMAPSAARERLLTLRGERDTAVAELDRTRVSLGERAPLFAVARELLDRDAESVPMSDVWAARDEVARRFDKLDIVQRRDLVRAFLDVAVLPFYMHAENGEKRRRGGDRIHVWHKVAIHLNATEKAALAAIDSGEGQSRRGPSWREELPA